MDYSDEYIKRYLTLQIKQSIINDVGIAIDAYSNHFTKYNEGVGYFAIPRLLFPEIDGLGSYITGKPLRVSENLICYMKEIMSQVDKRYGEYAVFIVTLYRHGLLHQHEPKKFRYKSKEIGWAFELGSLNLPVESLRQNHLNYDGQTLWINMNVFYFDVLASIDLFLPILIKKYKNQFNKSHKEQLKKLSRNSMIKRAKGTATDFKFLTQTL